MSTIRKKIILIGAVTALSAFALGCSFMRVSVESAAADTADTAIAAQGFTEKDYTFKGYSLRFNENDSSKTALRFTMQISPDVYGYLTSATGATTGTLVYPSCYLQDRSTKNLTVNSAQGNVIPYDIQTTNAWQYREEEGVYESVAFVTDLPKALYGEDLAVRGYLKRGEEYLYTAPTKARSLAYVANEEYADGNSPFSDVTKSVMRENLLKFDVKINGAATQKYYGEALKAPSARAGYIFAGYRIAGRNEMWDVDVTRVYGNAELTEEFVPLYGYSLNEGEASFSVEGLPAGITEATVNGREISCSTSEGRLRLSAVSGLTAGEKYLVCVRDESGKAYFAAFTAVNAILPYAYDDYLAYDFGDGVWVKDVKNEAGAEIKHVGSCLEGIAANNTAEVRRQTIFITDSANREYVFLLEIYTDVIYNNEEADKFFLGTIAGDEIYWEDAAVEQILSGCYALADNVTLSRPLTHTRTQGGLRGLFDGRGYKVTWYTDIGKGEPAGNKMVNGKQTGKSAALFGYNFTGTIRNASFDFTVTTPYNSALWLLSDCATAPNVYLENTFINIRYTASETVARDLCVVIWGTRQLDNAIHLKDVVVVNSMAQHGLRSAKRLLLPADAIWATGNVLRPGGEKYLGENNMLSRSVVDLQNAFFIVDDSLNTKACALSYTGDTGTMYAENNKPAECKSNEGWYQGAFIYNYKDVKTSVPAQVGSWKLTYGTNVKSLSADYQR